MPTEATKKLFTVDEYYKLGEVGVLSECVRTELIDGEILEMSPMCAFHAAAVALATELLVVSLHGKAEIRGQLPLRLSLYSEPEPDVCVVKPVVDRYVSGHPGPGDVLLVLEISDSSLRYDREVKLPMYAAAGVAEVWIEDLPNRTLHVYRQPHGTTYKAALQFAGDQSVSPLAFPEITFTVSALMGPIPA
jgi:Uma2 family endonuclease